MQIGRFFSAGKGQIGQYLSPRVLVISSPFQKAVKLKETCYFGFEKLSQAQKFARNLALSGHSFQLQVSERLTQFPYEIKLSGGSGIAKVLAYWDRLDRKQFSSTSKAYPSKGLSVLNERSIEPVAA